ncbi:unnamed protein product [Brassica rapa]|uniref:Uncharacterized protein n=1 Tax=Brassica campestris TaxID=3711 RepID=A0A8D9LRZ1_BRACM|nr:unnamed protein product [Brassica rapa]
MISTPTEWYVFTTYMEEFLRCKIPLHLHYSTHSKGTKHNGEQTSMRC